MIWTVLVCLWCILLTAGLTGLAAFYTAAFMRLMAAPALEWAKIMEPPRHVHDTMCPEGCDKA